ncbi:hypothetical protein NFI96_007332, partial [Prochilodus magdalenae]
RVRGDHAPLNINGSAVEIVQSTKFLGVHITENLTRSLNTSSIAKEAQQCLYFLWRLRKAHLPPPILTKFYRGTLESILSSCIIAWFGNCNASDRKTLQRIVRTAEEIIGVSLPSVTDIHTTRCTRKAINIVKDPTHPSHGLSSLLPSGRSLDITDVGSTVKPSVSLLPPSSLQLSGGSASLLCLLSGYSPQGAQVSWTVGGSEVKEGVLTSGEVEKNGRYSRSSTLTLSKTRWDQVEAVVYKVSHNNQDQQIPFLKSQCEG